MASIRRKNKRVLAQPSNLGSEHATKTARLTNTEEANSPDLVCLSDISEIQDRAHHDMPTTIPELIDLTLDDDPMEIFPPTDNSGIIGIPPSMPVTPKVEATLDGKSRLRLTNICFGMLVINVPVSRVPTLPADYVPVNVRIYGDLLKFHLGTISNQYIGLIQSETLGQISKQFSVTFLSFLPEPSKPLKLNNRDRIGNVDIHIVIYGIQSECDAVGSILSDDGLYLQHPVQINEGVSYNNPHFLLPPGYEMPDISSKATETSSDLVFMNDIAEDGPLDRKQMEAVFQTFDNVSGPSTYKTFGQSPRLKTKLEEHQMKALSMMIEKEQGGGDQPSFPSLWDVSQDSVGIRRYRHTITGVAKSTQPLPLHGGVLADEMGLGKTLSVLALIAWHIDSAEFQDSTDCATLVVTTLSSNNETRTMENDIH
ncbi:Helicase C-terminal [Penicillium malachiteum]|uniref:Helicase C-terminal n=1 Tax=Penicillium malachiteum TaxID=1324776 RepID=A0AAD6HX66_9EURO|nr:Helicase C-terminal [Penicillium malachiteum]